MLRSCIAFFIHNNTTNWLQSIESRVTILNINIKVRSHGTSAAAIFLCFHCVVAGSVHTVWLWQQYSNAMLMQNTLPLPQLHRIGLEFICGAIVTTVAIAAPCEWLR